MGTHLHRQPRSGEPRRAVEPHTVGHTLDVSFNAALTNVDGLANLSTVAGALNVHNNASLTDIDGLSNLTTTELHPDSRQPRPDEHRRPVEHQRNRGNLVTDNAVLTNVDGLSSLTTVEKLRVTDNPA